MSGKKRRKKKQLASALKSQKKSSISPSSSSGLNTLHPSKSSSWGSEKKWLHHFPFPVWCFLNSAVSVQIQAHEIKSYHCPNLIMFLSYWVEACPMQDLNSQAVPVLSSCVMEKYSSMVLYSFSSSCMIHVFISSEFSHNSLLCRPSGGWPFLPWIQHHVSRLFRSNCR